MITFFIPLFNEEKKSKSKLKLFLKDLKLFIKHPSNKKNFFYFYNDGSTDKTNIYLENLKKNFKSDKIIIINNNINKGVGYSFKQAINRCKTKFIFFLPGDDDINLAKDLLNLKKYCKWDLTFFCPINYEKYSTPRYFLSMMFRLIYGITFGVKVNYIQSPCLYKLSLLKKHKFRSNRMSIWPEVNLKLLKTNLNYTEVPIIFKNKSIIDRSVSLKNLLEVTTMYLLTLIEIKLFNRKKYSDSAKKKYV
jgi:hypothetical protein